MSGSSMIEKIAFTTSIQSIVAKLLTSFFAEDLASTSKLAIELHIYGSATLRSQKPATAAPAS